MTEIELPIFNLEFFEKLKKMQKVPDYFLIFTDGKNDHEIAKRFRNRYKKYIDAAYKVGLFQSDESKDLKKRLESDRYDQHFPALGHCKAAFFFSEMCGFDVKPVPPSQRKGKKLDLKFIYNNNEYLIEVKTPIIKKEEDIIEKLQEKIRDANQQFDETSPNILFLETTCLPENTDKFICSKAFLGQQAVSIEHGKETEKIIEQGPKFIADGILANPKDSKGKYIKHGDIPFTRTGAVICYQDFITKEEPNIFIIHNPYAKNQVSIDLFKDYQQLIKTEDTSDSFKMEWTR